MQFAKLLLLLPLALSLNACLDEIEIEAADRPEDGYVVQAKLIRGAPSYIEVKVEQLFFYTSNVNRPVNDATVSLVNKNGQRYTFTGFPPLNGVYNGYLEQSDFSVETGAEYRIEIVLEDESTLMSAWEKVYDVPQAERIDWTFTEVETLAFDGALETKPGIAFGITTPLPVNGEKSRLRWEFIDAYQVTDDLDQICYVENPYQTNKVFLADGNTIATDTLMNYPLFKIPLGIRHIEGYYLSVFQQALSPEAYNYWEEVAALLAREGTVFDSPAGTISSNISNTTDSTRLVYGFFFAYSQDTIRRFLSREEVGNLDFYCPLPPNGNPNPAPTICDDCLNALNSSYTKPDYWQ